MGATRTPRGGPGSSRRPTGPRGLVRVRHRQLTRQPRPRLTGRAAILLLLVAVLAVSYASSMRAYLHQRGRIDLLKEQIAAREAAIDTLEREKQRWEDPAFVRTQARLRFGYLMPGETGFLVLDEDGEPLGADTSLADPDAGPRVVPTAWWTTAWGSMELAGRPPAPEDARPAEEIRGQRVGRAADPS
jgi:cell division protein FtsB